MGAPSYPPLLLFIVLLLKTWYGLSDREVKRGDRFSFTAVRLLVRPMSKDTDVSIERSVSFDKKVLMFQYKGMDNLSGL